MKRVFCVFALVLLMLATACSSAPGSSTTVDIPDDSLPLTDAPGSDASGEPEASDPDTEPQDEDKESQGDSYKIDDNFEVQNTLTKHYDAAEEDLIAAAREVLAMYVAGSFENDNPDAPRYPEIPEGCSISADSELAIEEGVFVFPYSVTCDVGNSTRMIMGLEYINEKKSTPEKPEGWYVASVMFIKK